MLPCIWVKGNCPEFKAELDTSSRFTLYSQKREQIKQNIPTNRVISVRGSNANSSTATAFCGRYVAHRKAFALQRNYSIHRVPECLSLRRNWVTLFTPLHRKRVLLPPGSKWGEQHSLAGEGGPWGSLPAKLPRELCRACMHSFFNDCQSLRELRITSVWKDAAIHKKKYG